jgi:hypothetical protein
MRNRRRYGAVSSAPRAFSFAVAHPLRLGAAYVTPVKIPQQAPRRHQGSDESPLRAAGTGRSSASASGSTACCRRSRASALHRPARRPRPAAGGTAGVVAALEGLAGAATLTPEQRALLDALRGSERQRLQTQAVLLGTGSRDARPYIDTGTHKRSVCGVSPAFPSSAQSRCCGGGPCSSSHSGRASSPCSSCTSSNAVHGTGVAQLLRAAGVPGDALASSQSSNSATLQVAAPMASHAGAVGVELENPAMDGAGMWQHGCRGAASDGGPASGGVGSEGLGGTPWGSGLNTPRGGAPQAAGTRPGEEEPAPEWPASGSNCSHHQQACQQREQEQLLLVQQSMPPQGLFSVAQQQDGGVLCRPREGAATTTAVDDSCASSPGQKQLTR